MFLVLFFAWLIVMSTVIPITVATYKFRCKELEFDKERWRAKELAITMKEINGG